MKQETFRPIKGYEYAYSISNYGRVFSFHKNKFKKPILGKRGYYVIDLCINGKRKNAKIHRLIASAFIPNELNLPFINHKDGVKTNNSIDNLEWCTQAENNKHARENGLNKDIGSNHHNAKITEKDVVEIRKIKGKTQEQIASMYGISRKNVSMIINRKRWKHVK